MYTVIFPTNGIVLFVLALAAMIIILSLLLARKLSFKGFIAAAVLAAATIYRIIEGLGDSIGFPPTAMYIGQFNFIPFGKLFFVPAERYWVSKMDHMNYLTPIFMDMVIVFIFGIIWGILSPKVFKISDNKKYIKVTVSYMLPIQIIINFCHIFYISSSEHFDMGTYVLLFLGCLFGRIFFNSINAKSKKGKKE